MKYTSILLLAALAAANAQFPGITWPNKDGNCDNPIGCWDPACTHDENGFEVDCFVYGDNPNCVDMGYQFGWKDEGCYPSGGPIPFQQGGQTFGLETGTGDYNAFLPEGTVSITCHGESGGNEWNQVGIYATVDTIVIVKGARGGTVYNLTAHTSHLLDVVGVGMEKVRAISHIEFCFRPEDEQPPIREDPAPKAYDPCFEDIPVQDQACNFEGECPYMVTCCDGSMPYAVATCNADGMVSLSDPCMTVTCDSEVAMESSETPAPTEPKRASGSGDPHFKTWIGEKYDYHGECDLVLLDSPSFNNGQGLKIHIRTTRVKNFSYIEKVAVKIGDDVLEFDNDVDNFFINGALADANQKHHKTHLGGFVVRRDPKALSIRIVDEGRQSRMSHAVAKIDLHMRKNGFPAVIVDGGVTDAFQGSLGLMGDWETGKLLARDGVSEIALNGHDGTDFALDWQVRDTEPMLFKEARFPQFPTVCTPPAKQLTNRLGMSNFQQEAEKACAHWEDDMEDCIFDVIATRDIFAAEEGHIVHVE